MKGTIRFLGDLAHFYTDLKDRLPEIVPVHKVYEAALADREKAKSDLKKLGLIPRSRTDYIRTWDEKFNHYQENLKRQFAAFLQSDLTGANPFNRFFQIKDRSFISEELYRGALDFIKEFPGSISDLERSKRKRSIIKRIEKANEKIEQHTIKDLFLPLRPYVVKYAPKVFFDSWRDVQGTCSEKCNAQGLHLSLCSDEENYAYLEMGIGAFILQKGRLAYRP